MIEEEPINLIIRGKLLSYFIDINKVSKVVLGFLELEKTGKLVLHRAVVDLDNHTEDELNKMINKTIEIDYLEPINDLNTVSNKHYRSSLFTVYQVIDEDIDFEIIKA